MTEGNLRLQQATAERILLPYFGILRKYEGEILRPLSALPYPTETIKQGIKTMALAYQQSGMLDDESRLSLSGPYRLLAFFVSEEELAVFERLVEIASAEGRKELPGDAAWAEGMSTLKAIMARVIAEAEALKAEFEEYLKELGSGEEA